MDFLRPKEKIGEGQVVEPARLLPGPIVSDIAHLAGCSRVP